ncbi:MAG: hypothetical protein JSV80_15810 [Acidobacteriota bacterium]|nr:MAG: hypothetical protein JSV80_15810 [Acidobacteriota bacterium]
MTRASLAPSHWMLFALIATLVAMGSARIKAASVGDRAGGDYGDLSAQLRAELLPGVDNPLAPFQLSLGAGPEDVRRVIPIEARGYLKVDQNVYLHSVVQVPAADGEPVNASAGLTLLDGDLYFRDGGTLVDASLLLQANDGKLRAIEHFDSLLGEPDFEVVLPGALDFVVGWRTPRGFLLATFGDLPVFRVSAFVDDSDELLTGSQVLLFEGLSHYSRRLAAGESPNDAREELDRLLAWVRMARSLIKPGR